jgi:threonine dehydrogenase-like Zn-dependent dehydrogenase
MAGYMVYDRNALVHKVSSDLRPEHAAFVEPLSCSLHAVERARIGFEDIVVVAGSGPIGLGMVAGVAAKSPAQVVALDVESHKLELAKACGADVTINVAEEDAVARVKEMTGGYGADVYLEASGHPSAVGQGLRLLRKLGTFVEYSVFKDEAPSTGPSSLMTRSLTYWGLDVCRREQQMLAQTMGASYGDALLAAIGAGLMPPSTDWSQVAEHVEPDPANAQIYDELYDAYRRLYPDTKQHMHLPADMQSRTFRGPTEAL